MWGWETVSPYCNKTGMRSLAVQLSYCERWRPDRWTVAGSSHSDNGLSNRYRPSKSAKQNSLVICLFLSLSPAPQMGYCIQDMLNMILQWKQKSWSIWRESSSYLFVLATLGNASLFIFPATTVQQQAWLLSEEMQLEENCKHIAFQWLSLIETSSQFTERQGNSDASVQL